MDSNDLGLALATPQPEVLMTPNIGVIGVGGAGGNAVNNMIESGLSGVSFFAANTDAQTLSKSLAADKIQLGVAVTKGLGAGANPEIGKASAEESIDKIKEALTGLHLLFLTAGMGGGTGTGAAPVVAKLAKEMNILTVGVVSKPFTFEGTRRMKTAEQGIIELQKYVDTLIVIPNQNLYRIATEKMTFADGFKIADGVLCQGVRNVTDLIVKQGLINLDFADVKTVLSSMGRAMMGSGEASGENRALEAAEKAISNPLLDNTSVKGAKSLLLNISGGMDLKMDEVMTAAERIREELDPDANIIFGSIMDEELSGKIRISLVATGIDDMVNGSAEPVVAEKPTIPAQKPVEVIPEIKPIELESLDTEVKSVEEPVLMDIPVVKKETEDLIMPKPAIEPLPADLVVELDESPVLAEPSLIDEPVPVMPEITPIVDIPDIQPAINVETKRAEENVKPATSSIWNIFRPMKRKAVKPIPKKEVSVEPSFLDGLDDELPSFFKQGK
ncbi:MAG: cell division protein FtsZ [Alphaproteobacteria bacterium]|nr:cell division protein FtsZ [Alphaproteobacteria bacterium]